MTKRTKIIALLMLSLVVALVFVSFWSWYQTGVKTSIPYPSPIIQYPSPTIDFVQKPSFPPLTNVDQPTQNYDVSKLLPDLPSSVNSYHILKIENLENEAKQLASWFGFVDNPKVSVFEDLTSFSWSSNTYSLSISGDPVEVYYRMSIPDNLAFIKSPDLEYDQVARNFLTSRGLVPDFAAVSSPKINYFLVEKLNLINTSHNQATIIQLEYWLQLDGWSLLNKYPEMPAFTFRFGSDKTMFSFTGLYYPLQQEGVVVPILSVAEAKEKLVSGQGQLLYVFSQKDRAAYETKQYFPALIKINSVSLAYYYTPGQEDLSPVFVFGGTSADNRTKRDLETITLVSAVR